MCKESMQQEIINNKKKPPARSLFYGNPDEKHVFSFDWPYLIQAWRKWFSPDISNMADNC